MPARSPTRVYGSARGPLSTLASPLALAARRRRHDRFFPLLRLPPAARVLDVGCGTLGLRALERQLHVTGLDIEPRPQYPGPFVQADATVHIPFDRGQFDLVYCSSVIEHVPRQRRAKLAAEIARVGRGFFVQTPAWEFPIEPHSLLPFAHWLPPPLRRRYWTLGADAAWKQIELLRRSELQQLFGVPALPERVGPFVKSWVCLRPIERHQPPAME
ncbi:MAG: class I SAM-dependent methyltransferase [Solirubrobacteraceae bacterium]